MSDIFATTPAAGRRGLSLIIATPRTSMRGLTGETSDGTIRRRFEKELLAEKGYQFYYLA